MEHSLFGGYPELMSAKTSLSALMLHCNKTKYRGVAAHCKDFLLRCSKKGDFSLPGPGGLVEPPGFATPLTGLALSMGLGRDAGMTAM
ncbi:hypothetical protein DBR47_15415 [Paucibacter sp. KBW04]|nr:hypothetical protein DBR47_15415 [Paucibacter sp. KBW04]